MKNVCRQIAPVGKFLWQKLYQKCSVKGTRNLVKYRVSDKKEIVFRFTHCQIHPTVKVAANVITHHCLTVEQRCNLILKLRNRPTGRDKIIPYPLVSLFDARFAVHQEDNIMENDNISQSRTGIKFIVFPNLLPRKICKILNRKL